MLYDGHKDTEKLATSAKKRTTTLYEYASRPEFVRFFSSLFSIQQSKRTEHESGDHMKDATGTIHSQSINIYAKGAARRRQYFPRAANGDLMQFVCRARPFRRFRDSPRFLFFFVFPTCDTRAIKVRVFPFQSG